MHKKLQQAFKRLLKPLFVLFLVFTLALSHADGALAASGGRIGGGSFRMPSSGRGYSSPRTYAPPGGGYYPAPYPVYPGGGFGFPFVVPVFGFGGGLFGLLIFLAIAGFLVQSFRRAASGGDEVGYSSNSTVSISRLQVGLLANLTT